MDVQRHKAPIFLYGSSPYADRDLYNRTGTPMIWGREKRTTSLKRTDSGMLVFKGRTYTADEMRERSEVLTLAAHFLQGQVHRMSESRAAAADLLATDLLSQAPEWIERAKRCSDRLSPELRSTYEYLVTYMTEHSAWPTTDELAAAQQVKLSTIQLRLRALVKKGFVRYKPSGGLSLVDEAIGRTGQRQVPAGAAVTSTALP